METQSKNKFHRHNGRKLTHKRNSTALGEKSLSKANSTELEGENSLTNFFVCYFYGV
jgi:hypothetical protein